MPETDVNVIRLIIFFGLLGGLILLEWRWPKRLVDAQRRKRWLANLGIGLINLLVLRLILPGAAVAIAIAVNAGDWGLFNLLELPSWLTVVLSLLLLDLAIWAQHLASHHIPLLWRLHRMHHSDLHIDATTALRFHPLEILLSMAWKALIIALLGAPVIAVILFEILLNGSAMFNHANLRLPAAIDRWLRKLIVTPDMHRVHHSVDQDEHNRNFGFNLPWWDWLFGTYRAQPKLGHAEMTIGLDRFRAERDQELFNLLKQPLKTAD